MVPKADVTNEVRSHVKKIQRKIFTFVRVDNSKAVEGIMSLCQNNASLSIHTNTANEKNQVFSEAYKTLQLFLNFALD